jgi:hypothetical protein
MISKIDLTITLGEEEQNIVLRKSGDKQYISNDSNIIIEVMEYGENQRKYLIKHLSKYLEIDSEKILNLFQDKYEEALNEINETRESGLEYVEETEDNIDDVEISVPYNPESITVAPAKFSLREIINMVDGEEGEEPVLDLSPEFQRDYVWDNVRKSRLIESILLNIPLPMFYLSRDKQGRLQVVDGLQRLTTIYKFFKNRFKLTNLEYLTEECEGKYFKNPRLPEDKSLRPKLVRALRQYQIDCNIIEPNTPENVKLDIFKRLNTGGKELNKQEVRHAFMKKGVRDFLKELVKTDEFRTATDNGVNDKRMMAQELVLRYIGFYCLYINNFMNLKYDYKMDVFLDNIAIELNQCKNIPYAEIKDEFKSAMNKAIIMFGKYAFRKIDLQKKGQKSKKTYPINKSLFVAFSIVLKQYPIDLIEKKGNITIEFAKFLKEDSDFMYCISHNTNYQLRDKTMGKVYDFLEDLYK